MLFASCHFYHRTSRLQKSLSKSKAIKLLLISSQQEICKFKFYFLDSYQIGHRVLTLLFVGSLVLKPLSVIYFKFDMTFFKSSESSEGLGSVRMRLIYNLFSQPDTKVLSPLGLLQSLHSPLYSQKPVGPAGLVLGLHV